MVIKDYFNIFDNINDKAKMLTYPEAKELCHMVEDLEAEVHV